MSRISIVELEVFYHVGVPDAERTQAQRLLLTVDMEADFATSAATDDLAQTIDYDVVAQRLLRFGDGRSWRLIEKLAKDIADMILAEFSADAVAVEVKKFVIPQARYVAVSLTKARGR
jgi:dihydroneopterin aldolase